MKLGAQAEFFASQYLTRKGLRLIKQNYRCRFGEIDLILLHGETLVFAEVRLRSSANFGGAVASIDSRKQQKLIVTAQHYLCTLTHIPLCRFDALLLKAPSALINLPTSSGNILENNTMPDFQDSDIEWIKNAFSA